MRTYRQRARQIVASSTVGAMVAAGAVVVAGLAAGVVLASPASADPAPIGEGTASTVTADALPTAQINGVVWSQVVVGNSVYAAGNFTQARPAGVAVGGAGSVARGNLMSYNLATGGLTSFAPTLNAQAKVVTASPDGSRIYVGGSFTTANGQSRYRIAAYSTATGQLVSTFTPTLDATVNAITASNTTVYVGGAFSTANNVARSRLAAFSASDGALLGWAPTANREIQALVLTPNGSKVIAGGSFTSMNGSTSAYGLAALDSATGALLPWAANSVVQDAGAAAAILNLSTDGNAIYGSGYVFGAGGNLEGSFSADPETGAINWVEDCHGDTYSTFAVNGASYNVGHAHYCGNVGGYPQTAPDWTFHRALQFSAAATGTLLHNSQSPGSYADFGGQPSPTLNNWFPDLVAGTFTGQSQAAWSVSGNSQYVVLGGEFPSVNGVAQQGLVRFAVPSLATNKQGPMVTGANFRPSLLGISNTSVRVAWQANWDRDDQTLTYKVVRNGDTNHPVYTTTATSQFWNLPALGFIDTGLTPGATYQYRLSAMDSDGNLVWGDTTSVTVPTVSPSAYVQQVFTDGASNFWRLDEPSGTTGADSAGFNNLVLGTGVTKGAAGALLTDADLADTFSGTSTGNGGTVNSAVGPKVFSIEAWFKTTTTTGGKIVGFGSSQTGSSSSYDRHIYMDNAGHVIYGVYNSATFTLATVGTYNNGAWHHVVGTLSGNGMTLCVDGKKIGVNQGTTIPQDYTGYWRVGGDNLGSWPSAPSSAYFKGSIDEVSIYPSALTTAQVQAHYVNSGRTLTVPAVPSDTYGAAVYQSSPEIYWRMDDATGTAADDSSVNGAPGVYAGGVTKGVTSPVSGATGTAVTFNGSNGTVGSSQSYVNPSTYSEELWFSTTSTRGGKLIGFGNRQSGNSTSHDRDVYMLNSGQLVFGVNATPVTLTTPAAYNDGKWHHLVATQGNAGMRLYVDDQLVGSNTTTTAQNYTGYWRVGGDAGVTSTGAYLAGTIDEVAVYSTALTPAQVRAHYRASAAAVNALPVAAFVPSCTNLGCSFDGSASADADGSIAGYAWDFGDGATGTVAATSHTYTAAGTYPVVLTVTDDLGATSAVTHTVTVAPPPNVLPTAAFSSSASYLHAAFDANGSSDPDGSIASYAWDFGDGTTGTGVAPSHIYTAGGTYEVTLTVTDNRDGATSLTQALTVAANQAPVAAFTPTCTNLGCSFDGRESIDGDGSIVSYAWDFGDGATGAGATASRTYTAAGTFAVTLTVTDDQGATGSVSHTVTVAPPPNVPPIAAFTSSASYLHAAFNANGSSDPDGSIASYAWDFGDSTTGTGVAPSHTYAAGGTYQVELTVTDNRDGATSLTQALTVAANQAPVAAFTPTCTNLGCSFDGRASADADGSIAGYAWTFGDGATGTGATATHNYAVAGTFTVKLTITDDQGSTDAISQAATVTAPPTQPPSVSYTQNCTYLACTFDGSASAAKGGATITGYAWDFGDGTAGTGVKPSHTYAAPGPYVVTLTVTDSNTKSAFLITTVTVNALYAADTFTRTIASGGWGTANTGGAWGVSPASTFSVNGGVGRINLAAPASGPAGFLNSVSKVNLNVVFDASVDKVATGGGAMVNLIVRHVGTTDYRYKVRFMADGSVHLVISKVVSSTETTLREVVVPGLTFTPGIPLRARLQISGNGTTTLTGRVWTAGTTEPATNQITVTDAEPALQAAGSIGLQGYLSSSATNAPIVLSVDNLIVTSG